MKKTFINVFEGHLYLIPKLFSPRKPSIICLKIIT
jgi:hypothetical protein